MYKKIFFKLKTNKRRYFLGQKCNKNSQERLIIFNNEDIVQPVINPSL